MFEDYLSEIKEPLIAIETLTDFLEYYTDEKAEIFSGNIKKEDAEKIMSVIFVVKLTAKYMLNQRNNYYENLKK